jgi:SnoaL-like polyketide cyclase
MTQAIHEPGVGVDAQKNMETYFKTHDTSFIAEDAIFINMESGEQTKGREAIGQMINYIYHVAFDARADILNYFITEKNAVLEADFTGRHIGEFAGIQPTNKEVHVPLCITYDLENGLIKTAKIYMLSSVMMNQLKEA